MKGSKAQILPKARKDGLVLRQIPGELLVYDLDRHKAYYLNESAASVWKQCDGKRSVADAARALEKKHKAQVDEQVVWLALDQLDKFHLLKSKPARPAYLPDLSRRQMMRALGMTAAFALPVIVVITAPTAASAATTITNAACGKRTQPACGAGNPCAGPPAGKTCKTDGNDGNPCVCA